MSTTTGTIVIKPITAQLTRDTDTFSRMDPYVKVILGTRAVTTAVAKKAGKNPNWTDELTIRRSNNEDILKIEVWDKDKHTKDDLVGATSVSFSTVEAKKNKMNEWVELTYKRKSAGKVLLDIQFYPDAKETKNEQVHGNNTATGMMVPGFMAPPMNMMPIQPQQYQHYQQQQGYFQPQQQMFAPPVQQFVQSPPQMYQPGQFPQYQQQQQQPMFMQPQPYPQMIPNQGPNTMYQQRY